MRISLDFPAFLLAAVLVGATPAIAATAPARVSPTHQSATAGGVKAVFHFSAPAKPIFTCSMHPEVTSRGPGKCPTCGMHLEKQSHTIGIDLTDSHQKPVKASSIRLAVTDSGGMEQALTLKGEGHYQGTFCLAPGKQKVVARVKTASAKKELIFSVPYDVKK